MVVGALGLAPLKGVASGPASRVCGHLLLVPGPGKQDQGKAGWPVQVWRSPWLGRRGGGRGDHVQEETLPLHHWMCHQRDQALSLWSRSTDSETLDYQRINPREYQIELTQRKPLDDKTQNHPTTSNSLCGMPHLNNKQSKNTNPIISRQIPPHSALPIRGKISKQANKQKLSTNLTLYKAYTNYWTKLTRAKRKKEFNL